MTAKTATKTAAKRTAAKAAPKPASPSKGGRLSPLTSQAMLLCVEVHMWGNRRLDHKISDKAAEDAGAETSMMRTWKRLIGKDAMKQVTVPFSRYKAHHYENTVPWLDNGYRMLPSANYLKYVETERKLHADCMTAVDNFLKEYPKYRAMAEKQLGTAFSEDDYPQPSMLRSKWRITTHFMPIPDKADFRVDVPEQELARINSDIDGQVSLALKNAHRDLFDRLYRVVVGLRDKLKAYKVTKVGKGKKTVEGAFRESAIQNIVELCDLLPHLNFDNDPVLAKLTEEVRKSFGAHTAEGLKEDEDARAKTIREADEILAKMADYIAQ